MEKVRLGDVVELLSGYAFDASLFNSSEGKPIIRIRDIKKGYTETYTTEEYDNKYLVNKNDLLIGMDGEFNLAKWCGEEAILNQRVCKIIPKKINKNYLYYFLPKELKKIEQKTSYATVKHISLKQIENIICRVPDLEEQARISNKLDKIQEIIDIRKEQIKQLDELVKARFVELFGDPETNPNGWEKVTVGDVCSSIVRGPFGSALKKDFFVEPSDTTYKVYEQKHAIQKSATIGTYYVTEEKYQELKRFECVSGDILMSCSGTMGELYQLPEGCERGIINQALCKFTLNGKMLPICFLTYMKQTIGNLETKGSGIKNIAAVSYVKAMPINLPPMGVQLEFETFCKQTDKSKFEYEKSLNEMKDLMNSLMSKYFY